MNDEKKGEERLCASCDRCRSRKTKCDGKRPCGNCAAKYMKKNKLTSIDGVDVSEFGCIYSPAKRRGPVPGRSAQVRKASEMQIGHSDMMQNSSGIMAQNGLLGQSSGQNASWNLLGQQAGMIQASANPALSAFMGGGLDGSGGDMQHQQQQLNLLQQLQQQTNQLPSDGMNGGGEEPAARRAKVEESQVQQPGGVPRTVSAHTHLLDRSDPEGARLFAYYKLSIDELFRLPPTPTDEEYCVRLNIPGVTPRMIPGTHLAALSAARFGEVALGAIVHNEVSLAMELCNAVVHCLRESVQEPVQAPVMLEVAKAYFLLGVFRACRGDMARYFKYRRVCMTYVGKLETDAKTATLVAAISYLDSWAYMVYNANEDVLPDIDGTIPPVGCGSQSAGAVGKFDVSTVVSDPKNQHWIQGAPPVYLDNEAPLHARSLDALACAVRQCCDQANDRFAQMKKQYPTEESSQEQSAASKTSDVTPTATAVLAHENELCSRNMVLSAYTLMQQYESSNKGKHRSEGHHMVISAMDAFLENSEEDGNSGFTDSQIQSLLSVCNTAVENPLLLHHAGPTYHMVTNAAVLLCHLLNGMFAMRNTDQFGAVEEAMFDEVMDTFIAIRKLLTIHRRKLPVKLRCHGIPRPTLHAAVKDKQEGKPFVDLGETLLCACRGCQGFVLMACSPCVAAERAREATRRSEAEFAQEAQMIEMGELDQELEGIGAEFDVDDDALLNMISSLIQN